MNECEKKGMHENNELACERVCVDEYVRECTVDVRVG